MVTTNSKQTSWLFGNILTNGKTNIGRYSVSPNTGDQCAKADNTLTLNSTCIKKQLSL